MMKNRSGITLIELLAASTVAVLLIVFLGRAMRPAIDSVNRFRLRQKVTSEARICMETLRHEFRYGKPETVIIDAQLGGGIPPNSRIRFVSTNPLGKTRCIYWGSPNTIYLHQDHLRNPPPVGPFVIGETGTPIASNVTGLIFTGDFRDPSIIYVTLRFDIPYPQATGGFYSMTFNRVMMRVGSLR